MQRRRNIIAVKVKKTKLNILKSRKNTGMNIIGTEIYLYFKHICTCNILKCHM